MDSPDKVASKEGNLVNLDKADIKEASPEQVASLEQVVSKILTLSQDNLYNNKWTILTYLLIVKATQVTLWLKLEIKEQSLKLPTTLDMLMLRPTVMAELSMPQTCPSRASRRSTSAEQLPTSRSMATPQTTR